MKEKLWNEHIARTVDIDIPVLADDRSNLNQFFCADVVGNRRFAQNYGGWPRSDIAEINAQTSLAAAQNILNDLQIMPVSDINSGKSDAEILLSHKSKYLQTPSEQVAWLEEQIKIRDVQRMNATSQPSENTIKFDSDNPDPNE